MRDSLRQIVLDFDGVIADGTNRAYIDTYAQAVRAVGCRRAVAEVEAAVLRRWGESPRRELGAVMGDDHPLLDEALSHYLGAIDQALVQCAKPLPGALAAIENLAACYSLYLISGMGETPLNRIVSGFALQSYFTAIVSTSGSDLPERQKASGYHLRQLCRRDGWVARETLCVGDAQSDVEMARNCGVNIILVLTGALDREGAEALAVDGILNSLADLPAHLRQARTYKPA
jgi:phosphoglycolate phosphatase-like HAD superfamily hydrolase